VFAGLSYVTKVEIVVIVAIVLFTVYLFYSLDVFKGGK
jgi:hypothetical protein